MMILFLYIPISLSYVIWISSVFDLVNSTGTTINLLGYATNICV